MQSKYAIIGLKSKCSEIVENFFMIFRMCVKKKKGGRGDYF